VQELHSPFVQVLKTEDIQDWMVQNTLSFLSLQESSVFEEDAFEFEDSFS
jgi:hypothetical protein